MGGFKLYIIVTLTKEFSFVGKHLSERECPNWNYYQDQDGSILQFRKDHLVCVAESNIPDEKE